MRIDLCGFKAAVAKEPLDMFQLHTGLQQMRSDTVAKGVYTDRLGDTGTVAEQLDPPERSGISAAVSRS